MKMYYIEITDDRDRDASYMLQSKWFETPELALDWYKTIDFLNQHYFASLMSAEYDKVENTFNDIIMERFVC